MNNYHSYHTEVVFHSCCTCRLTSEWHFGSSASYCGEDKDPNAHRLKLIEILNTLSQYFYSAVSHCQ